MKDELMEKIERGHTLEYEDGDIIIWQFKDSLSMQQYEAILDDLQDHMPEKQHEVISDLEEVYLVKDAEVDTDGD